MATITCQIIDAQTGKPAAGMQVVLRPLKDSHKMFSSCTNFNGQVTRWDLCNKQSLAQYLKAEIGNNDSAWQIGFDTGRYFGRANTYWPVMDVNFYLWSGESFHMSILMGKSDYRVLRTLKPASAPERPSKMVLSVARESQIRTFNRAVNRNFTEDQVKYLREQFTNDMKPSMDVQKLIAQQLGVELLQVEIWFANQRLGHKRFNVQNLELAPSQEFYKKLPAVPMEQDDLSPEPLRPKRASKNKPNLREERRASSQPQEYNPIDSDSAPLLDEDPLRSNTIIETIIHQVRIGSKRSTLNASEQLPLDIIESRQERGAREHKKKLLRRSLRIAQLHPGN